jgi:hypothetical protein
MRYLGGHLGTAASALVDGQLDAASAERAWGHVHGCASCRRLVEREGWVKTQLSTMAPDEPPDRLIGSLYGLCADPSRMQAEGAAAWAAVGALEARGRARRRTGIALAGAGSVSVAVIGLASLSGATLGIGGSGATPSNAPTTAMTTGLARPSSSPTATTVSVAPRGHVHGRLPGRAADLRP